MYCPQCGTANPAEADRCQKCAAPLPRTEATVGAGAAMDPAGDATVDSASYTPQTGPGGTGGFGMALEPGRVLGNRYEILSVLGQGGMGAVYKVRDREINALAALKVIRPEMASRPEVLQRFKQELILARQVTHKNVIRIHDLGEADGMKFITMDYVEGRDLASLIRERGQFPPEEAAGIIAQICRALEAAHSEGVVHRDLKPPNVMIDKQGRVKVMDFGIARSTEATGGMTQTGAMLGTPEYMSPEQAKGQRVDARSDLFSLGIIFYEMLIGQTPFHADSVMATIFRRTEEKARPPLELDGSIPQQINDVVVKCLATNADDRFQSAGEILAALGYGGATGTGTRFPAGAQPAAAGTGAGAVATGMGTGIPAAGTGSTTLPPTSTTSLASGGLLAGKRKWIAAGAAVLVLALAVAIFVFRGKAPGGSQGKSTAAHPLSLAILPFRNASGDASLDWLGSSLSEMLRTDIGQSEGFRTVSPDRLHEVLNALGVTPGQKIDSGTLTRVAGLTDAGMVLSGQYVKAGSQIRIDARLENLKQQRTIPLKVEASSQSALLGSVDKLAKEVQHSLSLAPKAVREMQASAFRPSSKSVPALKSYSEGLALLRQGNSLGALKQFQAATKADPNFALAYSQLAQTYQQLGQDQNAQQYSGQAVDLSSNLPATEKYLIAAADARIENNYDQAVQAYDQLAKLLPDDSQVQFHLGQLYEGHGNLSDALKQYKRVLNSDPKDLEGLLAVGRVEIKSGDLQQALDPLNRALSMAVELNDQQAKANVLQAIGIAYQQMNRPQDALSNFQQSLAIKQKIGDKRGMAVSLERIARVQESEAKPDAALKSYKAALQIEQQIGDQRDAADAMSDLARFYARRGEFKQSVSLYTQDLRIRRDLGDLPGEALCLNNIGVTYAEEGRYQDALTYFQQSLDLRKKLNIPADIAQATYNVAEVYARLGQYDQAIDGYVRALQMWRKTGQARYAAVASDSLGTIYGYEGRYGAALRAKADAVKTFRNLHLKGYLLAKILNSYGSELSKAGHFNEAKKILGEAMGEAHKIGSAPLTAQTLASQGERLYYLGDFQAAGPPLSKALHLASSSNDRREVIIIQMDLAKLGLKAGRTRQAITTLRKLVKESDTLGLKYYTVAGSLYIGEALSEEKNYAGARTQLEAAVAQCKRLNLPMLLAQGDYLLAVTLRRTGQQTEASARLAKARAALAAIVKEAGNDALLKRSDIAPIMAR